MSKINLEKNSTNLDIKQKSSKPQLEAIGKQKSKDLHVNFNLNVSESDEKNGSKYLTAKFDSKELGQIKKRIQLEIWISDKLKEICKSDDNQIEIDLDKVYEIESDELKKTFLLNKLKELNDDKLEINKFVDSLLDKLN